MKFIAWCLLIISTVYVLLITPDNPVMRIFRGEISDVAANIIIGPYPLERDMKRLSEKGIETIISLLDPNLPYEKQLLEQETTLAKQYRLKLLNFPMASILGQKMGDYYDRNASAVADAIETSKGKIYLHCYLGIHRVATIKKLLEARQIRVGHYVLQAGERSRLAMQLDSAETNYHEGLYQQAKQQLNAMSQLSPAAVLLHGWVDFRLGNIAAARKYFNTAATEMPQATEPYLGLAYCDLRENDLSAAEARFNRIISGDIANIEALNGIGLVRYRQGRLPEAAAYLKKVLHIDPQHTEANAILQHIEASVLPAH